MNKTLIIVIGLVVVVGGAVLLLSKGYSAPNQMTTNTNMPTTNNQATTPVAQNTVEIKGFAFNPGAITVKVGTKVTWTNSDSTAHSATSDDGSFDTGVFSPGSTASVTFSKAGTFNYHCQIHPSMKGTVVVTQ